MALNLNYDINKAMERIEDELIASMINNLKKHVVDETKQGMTWTQWQVEQLNALLVYQQTNATRFNRDFSEINKKIEALLRAYYNNGQTAEEARILQAIKQGYDANTAVSKGFYIVNNRKIDALVKAVTDDVKTAETAILRQANDVYRQIIYDAMNYVGTGSGTYAKAVDMATKDMRTAGLQCIQYKNGAKHTLEDYSEMALKTGCKRAYLTGEGTKRQEWGIYTVIVNRRSDRGIGGVCGKCAQFAGKVYIDDVWGEGSKSGISPVTGKKYPLLSDAIKAGLYHPRCRDSHTAYIEGITKAEPVYTRKELQQAQRAEAEEQRQQYIKRQAKSWQRQADYALDAENKAEAQARADAWKQRI